MGHKFDHKASGVSVPWLVAAIAMVALIWGNSLVPGEGSSSISLAVVEGVRAALEGFGLPSAWVTNFLVRKTTHFTEYAILGILTVQALDSDGRASRARLIAIAALLALIPSIDEGIQLFVSGRSGQASDVLLDCCGAATGVALRHLVKFVLCCGGMREGRAG